MKYAMRPITYEDILQAARRLAPEEQRALRPPQGARVVSPQELRTLLASGLDERKPLSEEERAATVAALEGMRQLAAQVSTAWKDDISAVEAVRDVRREV